jgi:hypothetical protein
VKDLLSCGIIREAAPPQAAEKGVAAALRRQSRVAMIEAEKGVAAALRRQSGVAMIEVVAT